MEQNQGSKVFVKRLERSHLSKLTTADGRVVSSKPEILSEVEDFYGCIYASQSPVPEPVLRDPRATLDQHYTDELPDISINEIELASKLQKIGKSPDEDRDTTELLRARENPVLKQFSILAAYIQLRSSRRENSKSVKQEYGNAIFQERRQNPSEELPSYIAV